MLYLKKYLWGGGGAGRASPASRRKNLYFIVGSSGQFRLGEYPTANGRVSTYFSIKRMETTEDVLLQLRSYSVKKLLYQWYFQNLYGNDTIS